MLLHPLRRLATLGNLAKPLRPRTSALKSRPLTTSTLFHRLPTINRPQPSPAIRQLAAKRFFTTGPAIAARPTRDEAIKRLVSGAALFCGTLFAANFLFNRETREGGIPIFERQYLKETFTYTGLGIGVIGVAAKALHNVGWSYRIMQANPWLVLGAGLVGSLGFMFGTYYTDPDNYIQKHVLWTGFNLTQAVFLAPLFFYSPAILARAGLYTVGIMGSISYVASTAKEDKYIYLGGPLLAGCAVVALSGLAPLVLPVGSRALRGAEAVWLYGGLAVFAGFTLYDVQKVLQHARLAERGLVKKDTVNESIRLELDFLNIFIRLVQILSNQQQRGRR